MPSLLVLRAMLLRGTGISGIEESRRLSKYARLAKYYELP
jgi:hypothetical protein